MKASALISILQTAYLYAEVQGKRTTVSQPILNGAEIGTDMAEYLNDWSVPSSFYCSEKYGYFTVAEDGSMSGAARIKAKLSSAQSTYENCIAVPKATHSLDPLRLLMARAMPLNAPLVFKLVDDAF